MVNALLVCVCVLCWKNRSAGVSSCAARACPCWWRTVVLVITAHVIVYYILYNVQQRVQYYNELKKVLFVYVYSQICVIESKTTNIWNKAYYIRRVRRVSYLAMSSWTAPFLVVTFNVILQCTTILCSLYKINGIKCVKMTAY